MRILIMGQPRSGKSTLAKRMAGLTGFTVINTDRYRREWGYHEPWKGYPTEISPQNQPIFYQRLTDLCGSSDVIIEGSAIAPEDSALLCPSASVLLGRPGLSPEGMFVASRRYDTDWTSRREDDYLLKLFSDYHNYTVKWFRDNGAIAVDTTDYEKGLADAEARLMDEYRHALHASTDAF